MNMQSDPNGGEGASKPDVDESWRNSPRIPRVLLRDERLLSCSIDEYRQWQRQNPEQWLLRTPVLDGYVETVFDGEDRDYEPFATYWIIGDIRKLMSKTGDQLSWAARNHESMVHDLVKEWFAASSFPEEPTATTMPPNHPVRGATVRSSLFAEYHQDPVDGEPVPQEGPPGGMYSLRFRLMRAIGKKPLTWYELQDRLACEEALALRTLELAWIDGLIIRIEGKTMADPPTIALSEQGKTLFRKEKLSIADQGGTNCEEDRHVGPASEPWKRYHCPLCGGPVMVTYSDRGGTIEIACERSPRLARGRTACPAYWIGTLHVGRLVLETIGQGDTRIVLDRQENVTQIFVGSEKRSEMRGLMPATKLLSKLKTCVVYS